MIPRSLLVVDDESAMRRNIRDLLASPELEVLEAEDGEQALVVLNSERVDVVLLDIRIPGLDGIQVLAKIKERWANMPVILFTAYGTSERVIEAMKMGAYDYLEKPFEAEEMLLVIKRALAYAGLLQEVHKLRHRVETESAVSQEPSPIIGRAPCMQKIFKQIGTISLSQAPVLIEGESGTGKELVADAIQRHSLRSDMSYVKVNCGALSESLLESEIFGHERGAFTGATHQRLGHFETADGGTILLDEIPSTSAHLQVRLLRVLQQGTFFRVGGQKKRKVDVRLISLSNQRLEDEVETGRFRADLFYRINVIRINLPPLRDRREDIPLLVRHFVEKYAPGKEYVIPDETIARLQANSWPGNVRELENIVQRNLALNRSNVLNIESVPAETREEDMSLFYRKELEKGRSLKEILGDLESRIIEDTLLQQGGNRSRTAEMLRIHRRYLYSKMKQYQIR
ncbi:MAG: sigma-54-dependent Fis family transcriptional regulator [bacterium]|nr:sigma-54-dependent Fis family transcriptional regulator [bacterium]